MEDPLRSSEVLAARLQLSELQDRLQRCFDAQVALTSFLSCGADVDADMSDTVLMADEAGEAELLQEQIAVLASLIASEEGRDAAARMQADEAAAQEASAALAAALDARERWDASVLRAHDAAFAAALATCDEDMWEEQGDLLERPLDISSRPVVPAAEGCAGGRRGDPCWTAQSR
jgi:hypothetical protein